MIISPSCKDSNSLDDKSRHILKSQDLAAQDLVSVLIVTAAYCLMFHVLFSKNSRQYLVSTVQILIICFLSGSLWQPSYPVNLPSQHATSPSWPGQLRRLHLLSWKREQPVWQRTTKADHISTDSIHNRTLQRNLLDLLHTGKPPCPEIYDLTTEEWYQSTKCIFTNTLHGNVRNF